MEVIRDVIREVIRVVIRTIRGQLTISQLTILPYASYAGSYAGSYAINLQ